MALIPSSSTPKNLLRSFSVFAAISAMLMVTLLLSATPSMAAAASSSTTTSLTVAPASVASGSPVTMTATVSSGGTPLTNGLVIFCNSSAAHCQDSALLGSAWVTTSGTATLRRALPVGTTSIQASYQPTSTFYYTYTGSSSPVQAVTVTGTQPTITAANTFSSLGNNAAGILSADFNNDGIADLAVADASGVIQIFLGNGDGTFTTGASIQPFVSNGTGAGVALAAGDFNGDGNLDLVVDGHYILLGKGDGTFTMGTAAPIASGSNAQVADFNQDGTADLLVFSGVSSLQVLLGRGDGTFTAGPVSPSYGAGAYLAVADFNGDGLPDVAVTGGSGLGVQILLGKGDGSFTHGISYDTGLGLSNPVGIAVGDFNGDGKPDIAISDLQAQTITILVGNGDGTFTLGETVSTGLPAGSGAYLRQLVAADLNGDRITDLAVTVQGKASSDPSLALLLGNGDGTFAPASTFTATPSNTSQTYGLALGDFFSTGVDSLALLTGTSPSSVTVLASTSTGVSASRTAPVVTLATPAPIPYGTPLSATQFNASASVPGTFTYSPAFGTVLTVGTQTLSAIFTPTDTTTYSSVTATATLTVTQATPVVHWNTPAPIYVGDALTATQLNATTTVQGTFTYTPPAGTVLPLGSNTLSALFTPTDTLDYTTTTVQNTITVNPLPASYTLTAAQSTATGSTTIALNLVSTNYAGTVSFATTIRSSTGNPSAVTASAPDVTLTSNGSGSTILTITASSSAANHLPRAPWSGVPVVFGALLLGAPFALRRKRALAVLLTAAAITMAGFLMACSNSVTGVVTNPPRVYQITVTPTGTGTVVNAGPVIVTVTVK